MRHILVSLALVVLGLGSAAHAQPKKPNVLVIWGDDIGTWNVSHNNRGMMGYRTPNIDRIAREGLSFTDYCGQQSWTAGRAAFIGGTVPVRTGMTKVGLPNAKEGWQAQDISIAAVLKEQGYTTGQFGKNHFGDRDAHLLTNHGFDVYFGSLYHLNASEEPENRDYPTDLVLPNGKTFIEQYGPRGVIRSRVAISRCSSGPMPRIPRSACTSTTPMPHAGGPTTATRTSAGLTRASTRPPAADGSSST